MSHKGPINETIRICTQACASVDVLKPNGDRDIGTAFHVGEGVYLTARHVVEGNVIVEVVPYKGGHLLESEVSVPPKQWLSTMHFGDEAFRIYELDHQSPTVSGKPLFHPDPGVDVAAFKLNGIDPNTPALVLGGHYDDWINDDQWLLSSATVFGYPRIPTSLHAKIVVDRVTVNAVVDSYHDHYVRFVVSGIPRGGFSGGPAWHEWGFVLGMITESLEEQNAPQKSGYLTVLSIEALRECLDAHNILPAIQRIDV